MEDNNIFSNEDYYIYQLINKVNSINDKELTGLVQRLITERSNLLKIAHIDILTGVNNRRVLSKIQNNTGILMIDIDNFKEINDTFGHDIGDYVIKAIADIIKNNTRNSDYICRYGGDEFLVAFVDCPENVIMERAKKICDCVANNIQVQDKKITVSIGVAFNDKANSQIDETIKKADIALYQSKKNGKSQISNYKFDEDASNKHR